MRNFGSNGRLGNQIFQYLFLWSIAKKYNCNFYLPKINSFDNLFDTKYLSYINIDFLSYTKCLKTIDITEIADYLIQPIKIDNNFYYNFNGYFQNVGYFYTYINDIIHNELIFNQNLLLSNKSILKKYGKLNDLCAVHVRLTDYIKFADTFIQLDSKYYEHSIRLILSKNPKTKFLFYSDDIELCKNKYTTLPNSFFISNNNDIDDFLQISLCGSKIISNSTFSLCACLLDKQMKKATVIYPKIWLHRTKSNPIGDTKIKNWLAV